MNTVSKLVIASIGIVAKDILEDEQYIDVYPIELQPSNAGELSGSDTIAHTVKDGDGNVISSNITKTRVIKAKWLPNGDTNRLEPPTVCKGERVSLYRYGDAELYYWTTLDNQLELRKTEKRTIVVSNKQSIDVPLEDLMKYTYYFTMDSINKIVHLRTSDTDGEYTTYDIHLDTKEGVLTVIDGKDNMIMLESQDDKLTVSINNDIETNTKVLTNNNDESYNNSSKLIENNTDKQVTNAATSIDENTTDSTENIDSHKQINTSTFAVKNGTAELVKVISDFIQAVSDAQGIGNAYVPVPMDGTTKSALAALKAKVDSFIK